MSNTRSRGGRSRRSGSRGRRSGPGGNRRRSGKGSNWSRHSTALPGWTDLETPSNTRTPASNDDETFLQKVSTVRFAAVVLLVASAFTLYVGHVHATKNLLGQVQEARAENQRLHLKRNRLQGEFARKTSPSVIYERAREMGLEESVTYGPPVSIE